MLVLVVWVSSHRCTVCAVKLFSVEPGLSDRVGKIVDAVRVSVNSSSENLQYPVLFVVRQQKGVLSWQVPLIFRGLYQRTYNYQEVSRTLCPSEPTPEAGHSDQIIFVDVASMAPFDIAYELLVTRLNNFQLEFPQDVDSVIVKVVSDVVYPCSVVSIQDIVSISWVLSFFHSPVQKKDFPGEQFFVVFVIKPEDYACGGSVPSSIHGKLAAFSLESIYVQAMFFSFLSFLSFYLGSVVVAFNYPTFFSSSNGGEQLSSLERGPQDDSDTDSSVEEESDFDTMPEIDSDKNVIRTKVSCHCSHGCDAGQWTKLDQYQNIITIAVFYALPVVQLVITYQTVVNVTGNQDICYYNFLCAHPLGVLSAFNNILSNVGHVLLGFLFLLIVLRRDILHRRAMEMKDIYILDYGIPKHFGLFYAMGIALMMEGVLSACYHVCPNYSNFQFDTSFMYMIAGLCMLKLYQTRHPDINASAYSAYASFAVVICLAVLGVVFGKNDMWFWDIFSMIHVLASLALSTHIYYMGRFKIDLGIFRRAVMVLYTDCIQQCSRPMYMDRMVLLIVGNLVNWSFAIFGLVYRPRDFASYILGIFICNLLLYLAFYIIMKLRSSEKLLPIPLFCIMATAVMWVAALYFFFQNLSSWEETPAESREKNRPCILLGFFDDHDVWHFLSAAALFFSFLVLLTLDDDLDTVRRDKIPVF
uniref:SID1 transmembrane family member 1 n=1 Tax=Nothoprocta perdicaria TaxID=30464 RepID=A0A8C6ZB75_NOTPE